MTPESPTGPTASIYCSNCGSQKFDPADECWHCHDTRERLLRRLDRNGDHAVGLEVVASRALTGVRGEKAEPRWRVA